jgi:hypothetical protein
MSHCPLKVYFLLRYTIDMLKKFYYTGNSVLEAPLIPDTKLFWREKNAEHIYS